MRKGTASFGGATVSTVAFAAYGHPAWAIGGVLVCSIAGIAYLAVDRMTMAYLLRSIDTAGTERIDKKLMVIRAVRGDTTTPD